MFSIRLRSGLWRNHSNTLRFLVLGHTNMAFGNCWKVNSHLSRLLQTRTGFPLHSFAPNPVQFPSPSPWSWKASPITWCYHHHASLCSQADEQCWVSTKHCTLPQLCYRHSCFARVTVDFKTAPNAIGWSIAIEDNVVVRVKVRWMQHFLYLPYGILNYITTWMLISKLL